MFFLAKRLFSNRLLQPVFSPLWRGRFLSYAMQIFTENYNAFATRIGFLYMLCLHRATKRNPSLSY